MTIGQILEKHRGHGPGFDALRVYLAISVLVWHSLAVCGLDIMFVWTAWYGRWFVAMVPMFFTLSGFLVMGSASRVKSLRHYLANRFLRIFPALAVELTLSALVLGPLVTALPLREYFTSPQLYSYFGSLIGRVQFDLPGVFLTNPVPNVVNGNLWTIPPEIFCYLFMAAMIAMMLSSGRIAVTLCALGVLALNLGQDSREGWSILIGNMAPRYLVECFAFGATFYMWRDLLPYNRWLFAFAALVAFSLLPMAAWLHLAIFALAYCTAFLGCTPLPRGRLFSGGDYSYGIYLFGRPIQQTVVALFPAGSRVIVNLPVSLALSIGVAMLSWHFVEKRMLALRKHVASPDSSLRRHYFVRFAVLLVTASYGVALLRVNNIAPIGELTGKKLATIGAVVLFASLAGAAIPKVIAALRGWISAAPTQSGMPSR
jgi:peptidoglycan/LPS O-acetylase OafA/YrhL